MQIKEFYGVINKNAVVTTNTVSEKELAILSVRSYKVTLKNIINLPEGWVELIPPENKDSSGFSYGVYQKDQRGPRPKKTKGVSIALFFNIGNQDKNASPSTH